MGAHMGFDGKWAIHPSQIDIIHEAYTPTAEEIARAQRIVDEYEKADIQDGLGAIVIDDQMVDAAQWRVEKAGDCKECCFALYPLYSVKLC